MKKLMIMICAVVAGGAGSQFPEFAQQYRQKLDGAVSELSNIVAQFDRDAAASGLSRDEALTRYEASGDEFLGERGVSLQQTFARYERLKAHLNDLTQADPFERLLVFARDQEPEFTKATFNMYEPAIPVTIEGGAHAAGGAVGGWALLSLLLWPFGRRRRREVEV